jgi:hypothetical protein
VELPRRPWTEDELKLARDMSTGGYFYGEIDKALKRRAGSTRRRLEGQGWHEIRSIYIPDAVLAERDALAAARDQRPLTGYFCGDPPGYSALDGKTGQR